MEEEETMNKLKKEKGSAIDLKNPLWKFKKVKINERWVTLGLLKKNVWEKLVEVQLKKEKRI